MADKAIGSLVEATVINDADRFVLEQSGQAKQISGATMISELAEALDGHGGIQSINLVSGDGNVKTYRITFTDGTTYDYEVHDGESGNYAVVAGNLAPYSDASGATQSIPFLSQGTGRGNGSATVSAGNYCQLKKKLGNTVGVNQLARRFDNALTYWNVSENTWSVSGQEVTATPASGASIPNLNIKADYAVPMIPGHHYLFHFDLFVNDKLGKNPRYNFFNAYSAPNITAGVYNSITGIGTVDSAFNSRLSIYPWSTASATFDGTQYFKVRNIFVIDLTLWFGSNDRIPSDLLSHPENWGRYYAGSLAYNAGTLESADGNVLTSLPRNFINPATNENNKILIWANGNLYAESKSVTTDFYPVIPNTAYATNYYAHVFAYDRNKNYIGNWDGDTNTWATSAGTFVKTLTISGCAFVRFVFRSGANGNEDMTTKTLVASLYYPGESGYDADYPFSVLAEVDTGSEVLRSAGAVADEKTPDGTITRRVGVVDLGTLNWSYSSVVTMFYTQLGATQTQYNYQGICGKYSKGSTTPNDKEWSNGNYMGSGLNLYIKDSAYTDAAAFKTAMSGVYLYYELATPTTEQGTAFAENIPCDDFGSLMWTQTKGIPQGNEIFYPVDYKASIDALYNRVEGDMSRIVIDDDLADYNTKTEDESKFATKDAVGGTLRQLLASTQGLGFDDTVYVDLGNCSYSTNLTGTNTYEAFISSFDVPKANGVSNFLCSGLTYKAYADDGDYGIRGYGSSGAMAIRVPIGVASTPAGVKSLMKGVLLAYKKASS